MEEDNLLVEEIQTQIDVAKALVHKVGAWEDVWMADEGVLDGR